MPKFASLFRPARGRRRIAGGDRGAAVRQRHAGPLRAGDPRGGRGRNLVVSPLGADREGPLVRRRLEIEDPRGSGPSCSTRPSPASAACWARCCATACRFCVRWRSAATRRATSCLAARSSPSAENVQSGDTLSRPLAECGLVPENRHGHDRRGRGIEHARHGAGEHRRRSGSTRSPGKLDIMVRLLEPALLLVMGVVFGS